MRVASERSSNLGCSVLTAAGTMTMPRLPGRSSITRGAGVLAATTLSMVALGLGTGPAAEATATPSAWPAAGYGTGWSGWNSQEVTMTPARVKAAALNYSIPTAVDPNPDGDCLNPIGPLSSAGKMYDVGPDGITAYNQWSGAKLWNVPTPGFLGTTALMQIAGPDLVVFLVDCHSNSNAHSQVFVLNLVTGASDQLSWYDSSSVSSMVAVSGVIITSEYNDGTNWITAHGRAGNPLWRTAAGWGARVQLVATTTLASVTDATGVVTALRVADGSVAWTSGVVGDPLALSQDRTELFVTTGASLLSLNPATGAEHLVSFAGRGGYSAAVDATTVYSACAGTALCATRRSDGHSLWTIEAGSTAFAPPIVLAAGVVYFNGRSYLATTGKRIRSAADGSAVTSVSGGRIYSVIVSPVTGFVTAIRSYK